MRNKKYKNRSIISSERIDKIINEAINHFIESQKNDKFILKIDGEIPNFKEDLKNFSFSNKEFVDYALQLNEGLIDSYDIHKVKEIACRKYGLSSEQFFISNRLENEDKVNMCIIVLKANTPSNDIGDIKHFMQTCGYFECRPPRCQKDKICLTFEPRFSKNISNEIKEKYDCLYHATPTIYVDKILKQGLIPKSKSNLYFYPDRVFCMNGNRLNDEQITVLKYVQLARGCGKHFDNNEFTILKIDTKRLPDDIKFYVDPMSPNAVFTYDNIPPQAITISSKL